MSAQYKVFGLPVTAQGTALEEGIGDEHEGRVLFNGVPLPTYGRAQLIEFDRELDLALEVFHESDTQLNLLKTDIETKLGLKHGSLSADEVYNFIYRNGLGLENLRALLNAYPQAVIDIRFHRLVSSFNKNWQARATAAKKIEDNIEWRKSIAEYPSYKVHAGVLHRLNSTCLTSSRSRVAYPLAGLTSPQVISLLAHPQLAQPLTSCPTCFHA